ncbi:zinc finger protein 391-like [Phyllopteryx taeniolatus]|uniref:zinc finger protein 391-like n=1 Tax=Phyllopteryx taeniolatus TaxID=161469 RepID=UPI002AD4E682|nr:zinc finger protein 391-like [Phyllopteryx taeniolatus]
MCKVEMIRALLHARLSAAVEEICVLLRTTIAQYEEELCRAKEENDRQRRQLDAVCGVRDRPRTAGNSRGVHVEHQEPECSRRIKEEAQEDEITTLPLAGVMLKSEDDEGEHSGGPRWRGLLAPLSDSDDVTSRSPDNDDGERPKKETSSQTDKKRVKCAQCDKTFDRKSLLIRHTRTHTGEKPFACSVCGKRFSMTGNLTMHTKTHTGEKPFACSVCGKGFIRRRSLTTHARTHTGEKPFSCSVCHKRFNDQSWVKRHKCAREKSSGQ